MDNTFHILACSGPGAGEAIARNIAIGYYYAATSGFIMIWHFRLRSQAYRDWPAYLSALLFLLHPAWTISAVRGDCGFTKVALSGFVLLLLLSLLVLQILTARRYKKDA